MRILLLSDGIYPYVMGGMQKHSYYLTKYLAKNKIKIDLFHCINDGDIPKHQGADEKYFSPEELNYITFHCLPFPKTDSLPGHYLRENKKYSQQIFERVKDRLDQYGLIYAQGYTGSAFMQARKKGQLKSPIVVNFHGYEMYQQAPSLNVKFQHLLLRPATKWHNQNADYVSSFGGVITEAIRSLGIPEKQIIELPIGIEQDWLVDGVSAFHAPHIKRKFVFIGRYERRKGIEELNQVLGELLDEGKHDFEFHFIGPIPEDKRIKHPHITYYGKIVEPDRIKSILQSCDVLVCPSYSEGMPTVILEGMASGLAIIATKVGAVEKQLQGNGWLLDKVDNSLLKQAIMEACEISSEQLITLKTKSLNLIQEKFLWDKVVELMLEEFKKIAY